MRTAVTLLLLVACGTSEPPVDDTDSAAPAVDTAVTPPEALGNPLDDEDFAWCHEDGADADQAARWCPMLEELPEDVCPGLRATCEEGVFEVAAGGCEDGLLGEGGGVADGPEDGESPRRRKDRSGCDGFESGAAEQGVRWAMAGLAALLVFGLLVALLRAFGFARGAPREPSRPSVVVEAAPEGIEGDDDLPALPEDVMLAKAREALDAGELGEAVVWARGAALRRLARQGLLRLHRARTDREYLRALRRQPEARDELGVVLRAVEDHRWAGRSLTEPAARSALDAVGRLLLALSAVLLMVMVPGSAEASRRYAPHGDAGLHQLFEEAGFERVFVDGLSELEDDPGLADIVLVDRFGYSPSDEDWAVLQAWVEQGGTLWLGGRHDGHFPELGRHETFAGSGERVRVRGFLKEREFEDPVFPSGPTYQWCGDAGFPLVVLAQRAPRLDDAEPDPDCPAPPVLVAAPRAYGWVIGLSDPMLLANGALMSEANRELIARLPWLGEEEGLWSLRPRPRVLLVTSSTASSNQPNPFTTMANVRLLPFVLQLLVFWALLALWRGWPLATPREEASEGRHDFVEHVDALAQHWEDVGATRHAASASARLAMLRYGHAGIVRLAHAAGRDVAAARNFADEVAALADDPDGPNQIEDFELVEELWQMTRHR